MLDRAAFARTLGLLGVATVLLATGAAANERPGEGTAIQPISTGRADHYFQHFVVQIGLEELGYRPRARPSQLALARPAWLGPAPDNA